MPYLVFQGIVIHRKVHGNTKLGIATSNRKAVQPGKKYASFTDVVWVTASNCEALPDQTEAQNYQ